MYESEDFYPSRTGRDARLLKRHDPVVFSDDHGQAPLAASQVEGYAANGYLVAERLFDAAEVRVLLDELRRVQTEYAGTGHDFIIREPGSDAVRSVFEIHKLSPVFRRLVRDSRLVDIASYLLGGSVYVHQSRLNYKPGFQGKDFYWHSDFETWHVEDGLPRMRAVSVSVSLTDNVDVNGPLMLVPGSHLSYVSCPGETPRDHYRQSLRQQQYGVPPDDLLRQLIDAGGIDTVTGPAGSATFFDCNTMHGSNSNISPFPRANAFIVYNSTSNRPGRPFGVDVPRPGFLAERADFTPLPRETGSIR